VFSEENVEEHGYAYTQHGVDATKLGHPVPSGEEGRLAECGGAIQERSFSSALNSVEMTRSFLVGDWQP